MKGHVAAVIAAFAAVVAAGVGGYLAYSGARDAVREENRDAARRLDAEARGAARILSAEFFIAAKEMSDFAADGYFHPFGSEYDIAVSQGDLRLIASRVSTDEWTKIYLALSSVQGLERYVRLRSRPQHPLSRQPLSRHTLTMVKVDMDFLGEAIAALSGLADLNDVRYPTLDVDAADRRLAPFRE
jgi:hypothetical protein